MMLAAASLRRLLFLPFAFLLLALPLGCKQAELPPGEPIPRAPVKWESARKVTLSEWTELVGTAIPLPDRAARITAPVEGRVLTVLKGADGNPVIEGKTVGKGDVIAQLDATVISANRDQAEAQLKVLQEDVVQAGLAVQTAKVDVERLKELKDLAKKVEITKANLALQTAESQERSAKGKLEAGQKTLDALNVQLRLYTLTAPLNGRLGRIQVVPGQTLSVGTFVTDVVDVSEQIDVICFVSAQVVRQLQLDQNAEIGGLGGDAASPGGPRGKIVFIAEQAEPDTGNYAVKVRFPNKEAKLSVNAVVQIRVEIKPDAGTLGIPEAAVMEDQDPPIVVIVEPMLVTQKEIAAKDLPAPVSKALKKDNPNADVKKIEEITKKTPEDVATKWEEKTYRIVLAAPDNNIRDLFFDANGVVVKNDELGVARRLRAELGIRDRKLNLVEITRLTDPENKWNGDPGNVLFVTEKGQGLQTGDFVKLQVEEDE
jgi:RND family efflux transporter MFP subunit